MNEATKGNLKGNETKKKQNNRKENEFNMGLQDYVKYQYSSLYSNYSHLM